MSVARRGISFRATKRFAAIVTAIAVASLSVNNSAPAVAQPTMMVESTHSSRANTDADLLAAILFAAGPEAHRFGIPATDSGVRLPDDYTEVAYATVKSYLSASSTNARDAIDQLSSGDVLSVETGLRSLVQDFNLHLAQLSSDPEASFVASASPDQTRGVCSLVLICAANIAVFINVAVAVTVALAAYVITSAEGRATGAEGATAAFIVRLTDAARR